MKKGKAQSSFKLTRKVADERRARVVSIVTNLPEADAVVMGSHLSLEVRRKRFGWYMEDHHGDGRLALNCKAPRSVAQQLATQNPERFHIPKYVGRLGWIGLWLDTPQVDWKEVQAILVEAYCLAAPKQLIAKLGAEQRS
jgi:hypothetical protein